MDLSGVERSHKLILSHLFTYPKKTVVVEKLEAMVSIGMENTRFKDIYDIIILQRENDFDGPLLSKAVNATRPSHGKTDGNFNCR